MGKGLTGNKKSSEVMEFRTSARRRIMQGCLGSRTRAQGPALRKLRALARESDKNRLVMATPETKAALVEMAFGSAAGEEFEAEAMAVLAMVGMGEAEAVEVVGREGRVARLGELLGGQGTTLESRVNAGAVVEAAAAASGAEARAVLGAAEGVMEGLVALVEEKANARAVRVGIRGLFALCLAKENQPRAVAAGAAAALARRVTAEARGRRSPRSPRWSVSAGRRAGAMRWSPAPGEARLLCAR
ncbi:hypothetical protein E2562_001845 [Oryza meyeriana var. granulata]|uniref:U-box domain-containing protein n=1 Tax=Oryza meyeriana var. granulata TaxID=110450 RepID=A0A6G1C2Y8_9ORYZ|nr:hypothetical protein E2562_001845 [Oryza meyeriana var. granulata]